MSNTPTSSAQVAEGMNLLPCPECQNEYLAIRTDIYKDEREFVYCDCCGCIAVRSVWNAIRRTAAPVAEGGALPPLDAEGLPPMPKAERELIELHQPTTYTTHVCTSARYTAEHMQRYARQAIAPYAERIRQLERELEARAKSDAGIAASGMQSIGGDPKFINRMNKYFDLCTATNFDVSIADIAWKNLVAHIDGRTAGPAVPEVTSEEPRAQVWQPMTGPGQVRKGDKLRFKIGDKEYKERAKLILEPGTSKEEVVYDIGRNFYFITSMVVSGKGNHKGVEFLAAAPKPQEDA